jgi:hypothetical protein
MNYYINLTNESLPFLVEATELTFGEITPTQDKSDILLMFTPVLLNNILLMINHISKSEDPFGYFTEFGIEGDNFPSLNYYLKKNSKNKWVLFFNN